LRIFLDACIDPKVAELFPDHEVTTAHSLGWHRLPDHELVKKVNGHFEIFLTIDRGLEFEHNLSRLSFVIVIAHVMKNQVAYYRQLLPELDAVILSSHSGAVVHVPSSSHP
jgi:hypothetical protein